MPRKFRNFTFEDVIRVIEKNLSDSDVIRIGLPVETMYTRFVGLYRTKLAGALLDDASFPFLAEGINAGLRFLKDIGYPKEIITPPNLSPGLGFVRDFDFLLLGDLPVESDFLDPEQIVRQEVQILSDPVKIQILSDLHQTVEREKVTPGKVFVEETAKKSNDNLTKFTDMVNLLINVSRFDEDEFIDLVSELNEVVLDILSFANDLIDPEGDAPDELRAFFGVPLGT